MFDIEDLGQQRLNARALAAVLRQAGLSARCLHSRHGMTRSPSLMASALSPSKRAVAAITPAPFVWPAAFTALAGEPIASAAYPTWRRAWFSLLLRRRFQGENPAAEMRALRETVARLNRAALDIWREMIALVETEPLPTVEQVNEQAAAWAGRVNTLALYLGKTACLLPHPRRLPRPIP